MERINIQNMVVGALFALLSWNIWTTHQLSISIAVLTEKVSKIERALENVGQNS